MKKIRVAFLLLIIMSLSLTGCNNKELMKYAQEEQYRLENAGLTNLDIDNKNYGTIAYKFLEYIQNNLPGRIAGSEKEKETAALILNALLEGGYTENNIEIQNFEIGENSAPLEAVENNETFNGGALSDESNNIEVTKSGESEKMIIVGAHYDSASTHGVIDNGSGISVVLENALRMVNTRSPYTIRYVFFGAEEIGMYGSRAYVDSLSQKEKDNILFMVNIDCVASVDIAYLYGGNIDSDGIVQETWAVEHAYGLVQKLNLEIQLPPQGNLDYPFPTGQKRSDFTPFSDIGIPYIYFESNNWENGYPEETKEYGVITHTQNDDLNFINQAFPQRVEETLTAYSELLYTLLKTDIVEQP